MNLKPLVATFLLAVLILSLACSSGENNNGKINLRYMRWGLPEEIEAEKLLIAEFEKANPDIKVTIEYTAWSQYWTKLQAQMASKTAPDVFLLGGTYLYDYVAENQLVDLQPFVDADAEVNLDDYFSVPVQQFQQEGQMWALPRDCNTIGIFYNKTLFDQYGVEYPKPGWTWDDFLEKAKALTVDENNDGRMESYGYLASFESQEVHWISWVWQAGGDSLNADRTQSLLNTPESVKGLRFLTDLVAKHRVSPGTAQASTFGSNMFLTGRLAMSSEGSWMMRAFSQADTFEWDVAPLPEGDVSVAPVNGLGNAIYTNTEDKEAAWRLVKFLSSKQYQEKLGESGTSIPALKEVAYSPVYLSGDVAGKPLILQQMETARPMPFTQSFEKWESAIRSELELVWLGRKELEPALESATLKVNEILKKNAEKE
ncbi:MAG: ABC transporter substrate-binding protein [Sumerlaeia bacterium]